MTTPYRLENIDNDVIAAPTKLHGARRANALLKQIAAELAVQADDISLTMVSAYVAEIPAYAAISDQSLRDDVQAVSTAMVRCWLTVMSTGDPIDTGLLEPVVEGVRRRVAQGMDLQSMLRAFRVGIRVMWSEITSSPVWRSQPLQGSLVHVATWALDFADQISTAAAAAYVDESDQMTRERMHRRSGLLDVILSGAGSSPIACPQELESRHSVAVVRVSDNSSLLELERIGDLLESRGGAVLWTVRHRSVVAIITWPLDVNRSRLGQRLGRLVQDDHIEAIGLGGLAEGAAETRQSYAEASSALRLGLAVSPMTRPIYDFQDLAPVVAILEQPERARRFADGLLEPLGTLVRRPWVLPTLEVYLSCQGRLKEVASTLDVHPNTVKYRLRELRAATDLVFADGDRAMALLLALRVRRALAAG